MISEYDVRQIDLMKERISQFNKGEIQVDKLINDLESLLNCLENISENWKDYFLAALGEIEIIYAFALYENRNSLTDEDMKVIDESLLKIESLMKELP
jgi:hypothetical protein